MQSLEMEKKNKIWNETEQGWLLGPTNMKKKKYVDLGCIVCSGRALKWTLWIAVLAFFVIALPIIISYALHHHSPTPARPDNYTLALHMALDFFDAQKSGRLPKNYNISWRGNSGLTDGIKTTVNGKSGLIGGYYDAGGSTKFHFPMAFAMSMLSWSVIEYNHKYRAINEYDHIRELIKWGTDYLLLTFDSSAKKIDKIYSQVGRGDHNNCWQRPEDMDNPRHVLTSYSGADLAAEVAAALAAASIVFKDDDDYSKKLVKSAKTVFNFATDPKKQKRYSLGQKDIEPFYNSSGYLDEYLWGATWLYYATGNTTYLSLATDTRKLKKSKNKIRNPDRMSVLSWNNKYPAAMLLLTRLRILLSPGYPYEDMLREYHDSTVLTMCSYMHSFRVFNWTRGGMIKLNRGRPQPLQYVANAAFLASLFLDYLNAIVVPGFSCGPSFITSELFRNFTTSQMDYILGANPNKTSYVVGYGDNFPRQVHHRGASTPHDGKKYSCSQGTKWLRSHNPNPNNITGAMVGGPDRSDNFKDVRFDYNYTEPTLAGNAGLVAALVSLTVTSSSRQGVDRNTIFSAIPPVYPATPPPPAPWTP